MATGFLEDLDVVIGVLFNASDGIQDVLIGVSQAKVDSTIRDGTRLHVNLLFVLSGKFLKLNLDLAIDDFHDSILSWWIPLLFLSLGLHIFGKLLNQVLQEDTSFALLPTVEVASVEFDQVPEVILLERWLFLLVDADKDSGEKTFTAIIVVSVDKLVGLDLLNVVINHIAQVAVVEVATRLLSERIELLLDCLYFLNLLLYLIFARLGLLLHFEAHPLQSLIELVLDCVPFEVLKVDWDLDVFILVARASDQLHFEVNLFVHLVNQVSVLFLDSLASLIHLHLELLKVVIEFHKLVQ